MVRNRCLKGGGVALIALGFFLAPYSFANHHGTRCRFDVANITVKSLSKLASFNRCPELKGVNVSKKGEEALARILKRGAHHVHDKPVPAVGLAYSLHSSFDTCQVVYLGIVVVPP